MAIELYNQNGHVCLMFAHLSDEGGEAVQANQFLVIHGDTGAIIDPGGNVAYNELLLTIGRLDWPCARSTSRATSRRWSSRSRPPGPSRVASLRTWPGRVARTARPVRQARRAFDIVTGITTNRVDSCFSSERRHWPGNTQILRAWKTNGRSG